jgi:FkbM family methyltransferase
MKTMIFKVASCAMRGRKNGLNAFGRAIDKAARYIVFVGNEERLAFENRPVPVQEDSIVLRNEFAAGVVYDVGANNGDDTEYYLKKGFRVVAIEAHPGLASHIRARFAGEFQYGRLQVLNVAVGDGDYKSRLYVNSKDSKLCTLVKPIHCDEQWSDIEVDVNRLSTIVKAHGCPAHVKLDVEGADVEVLREMFSAGCFPESISAEAHSIEVLCLFLAAGYHNFKIVEGKFVHSRFCTIRTVEGALLEHKFPAGTSAGPFGDDLPGSRMGAEEVFCYLREHGLGWKDIHAFRN